MSPTRSLGRPVASSSAAAPRHNAFTLIELLIVITIIAILIGLLFPAFAGVQERARRVQAQNDIAQILTAINGFYTDYGAYPVDPGFANGGFDVEYANPDNPTHSNSELMNTLRAIDDKNGGPNGGNAINPRQVVYFNGAPVKNSNSPRSGFDLKGEFWDPWGSPSDSNSKIGHYIINIDSNYDGITQAYTLDYTDLTYDTTVGKGIRTGVIAASLGRDGSYGKRRSTDVAPNGNKIFKGSDDVLSWQ